jgi:hypothetical protein
MWKSTRLQGRLVLAVGALLGYGAAAGGLSAVRGAGEPRKAQPDADWYTPGAK